MRFNSHIALVVLLASVTAVASGCGILGEKKEVSNASMSSLSQGCFDGLGKQLSLYFEGNLPAGEWISTWDCVSRSLNLFSDYAVGSLSDGGYSENDIHKFTETFLFKQQKVSDGLIHSFFLIKAVFLGGSRTALTPSEVKSAVKFFNRFKTSSARLLPHLKNRLSRPFPKELKAFAIEFVAVNDEMAAEVPSGEKITLTVEELDLMLNEFRDFFGLTYSKTLAPFVMTLKACLVSGDSKAFNAVDLPKLLALVGRIMGPAFAALSLDKEQVTNHDDLLKFYLDLIQEMKPALTQAVQYGNGAVSFRLIDELIDSLPSDWTDMNRKVLKKLSGVFVTKFLKANTPRGLDVAAIDTLYSLVGTWVESQSFLEILFRDYGWNKDRGVAIPEIKTVLGSQAVRQKYSAERVNEMQAIVRRFRPIFQERQGDAMKEGELTIKPSQVHTFYGLAQHLLFYQLSNHLVSVYSSDSTRTKILDRDVEKFTDDIKDFLVDIKFTDRVEPGDYKKRLVEADYFTYESNGDGTLDSVEIAYYIQYLLAISKLSDRVRMGIEEKCSERAKDPIGWSWMKAGCFRNEFFGKLGDYAQGLPHFIQYYNSLSFPLKQRITYAVEYVGRRYGAEDIPIGNIDVSGMVGTLVFIETVFNRFDEDQSGKLETEEVIKATPLFGDIIAQKSNGAFTKKDTKKVEAAFSYTTKFGEPPQSTPGGIAKFLGWMALRELGGVDAWNLSVPRDKVFGLLPVILSPPLPCPKELPGYGPVSCSQNQ